MPRHHHPPLEVVKIVVVVDGMDGVVVTERNQTTLTLHLYINANTSSLLNIPCHRITESPYVYKTYLAFFSVYLVYIKWFHTPVSATCHTP